MSETSWRLTRAEIASLKSLPPYELDEVIESLPTSARAEVLAQIHTKTREPQSKDEERRKKRERIARQRAAQRDLVIPRPLNVDRRLECLAEPKRFLKTYFENTFYQTFTRDREAMLESIVYAAKYGGDHAIAGPRGEGKTRLAIYGAVYLMIAQLSPFPMVIGKSQTKSANELKTIRERLQQSEILIADFPEIGIPFRNVGGWSSRCRMQTVGGRSTNIEISSDHLIFPTITREQLPDDWPDECEPVSAGQIMSSLGIDGPIRGTNYRDRRPSLAILDDIESKESADSDVVISDNEQIIESDIAFLGSGGRRVSRVMLCTTQNRKCIAFIYTDPKQKRSWHGVRFRKMVKRPDREDLWQQYVELRMNRSVEDPDAREAFRFYRDNRDAMDRGCEISNPYSYDTRNAADGEALELSAIQAYYNRVADFGEDAVATEDDNDPPETVGPQGSGLTAAIVQDRNSGLDRLQLPANTRCVTVGIDLGKYVCHWTMCAWWKGAGGVVVDYGAAEVKNTSTDMSKEASEPMIYNALLNWREELLSTPLVDASGASRTVNAVFVDSGDFTDAAYEFVRNVGGHPFHAVKGRGGYRQPTPNDKLVLSNNAHAHELESEGLWLWTLNTDYWKRWVHERFLTPTFDADNMMQPGAMSIFQPGGSRRHLSFSQHIVAEEWVSEFKPGKGEKQYWLVHNRNNHWLDATYMAAAAAATQGINVMTSAASPTLQPTPKSEVKPRKKPQRARPQHGFRTRPGGWVPRRRRR